MNITQKKMLLKNELTLMLKKARITEDDLKQIKKKDREEFIQVKLLEINDHILRWALHNGIVNADMVKTDDFFVKNKRLSTFIVSSGILTAGSAMASVAGTAAYSATLTTVTTGGFLGFFTTTTTVATTTTFAATAAATCTPIALAGLSVYAYIRYKEKKYIQKLLAFFDEEKKKIHNYYINKIDMCPAIEAK
jgi:hypothetical protein